MSLYDLRTETKALPQVWHSQVLGHIGEANLKVLRMDKRSVIAGKRFQRDQMRVAGDNTRARHVYETCGFGITGVNMSKSITDSYTDTR